MNASKPPGSEGDPILDARLALSDADFAFLSKYAHSRAGIVLTPAKRQMVYGRLVRRLRTLGLTRFSDYCRRLEDSASGEHGEFINAITTNLTWFFREPHHFEHLAGTLLPGLYKARAAERKIRIWSSAASTGEEPYSIAMVLAESLPAGWQADILATDIDSNVLTEARAGVYPEERLKGVAPARRCFFQRGTGGNAGFVRVKETLRQMIRFEQMNLLGEWPAMPPFDVIFCRNVLIYFDRPTQTRLVERFASALRDDGCYYAGHSEPVKQITAALELDAQATFYKTGFLKSMTGAAGHKRIGGGRA